MTYHRDPSADVCAECLPKAAPHMPGEERCAVDYAPQHRTDDAEVFGRQTAMPCFGYRRAAGPAGSLVIDAGQAKVVRRAFDLRKAGFALDEVAAKLNRMSAHGRTWTGCGVVRLLLNRLYDGTLVYGRTKVVRDAVTGVARTVSRPEKEWTVVQVEHLRIVDHAVWEFVRGTFDLDRRPGVGCGIEPSA